jgi:hypothetical protein
VILGVGGGTAVVDGCDGFVFLLAGGIPYLGVCIGTWKRMVLSAP